MKAKTSSKQKWMTAFAVLTVFFATSVSNAIHKLTCEHSFRSAQYSNDYSDPFKIGIDEGEPSRFSLDDNFTYYELGQGANATVFRAVSKANPHETKIIKIYVSRGAMTHEAAALRIARRATIGIKGLRAVRILNQGKLPNQTRFGYLAGKHFIELEDVRGRSFARPTGDTYKFESIVLSRLSEMKKLFWRNIKYTNPFAVDESKLQYGNVKFLVPTIWGVPLPKAQVSLSENNLVLEAATGDVVIVDPQ